MGSSSFNIRVKKTVGLGEFGPSHFRWTPVEPTSPRASANAAGSGAGVAHKKKKQQAFSLPWNSIKDQQVSSSTSPKALIRLNLVNKTNVVLEFVHPAGLETAFSLRDEAKTLLAEKLVNSNSKKRRAAPLCSEVELKQRAALLASQPTLKQQHEELVGGNIITEEEFWSKRKVLLAAEIGKRQKVGKTSQLLTDFNQQESGVKGGVVKYNLNAEIIHQIFVQFPSVQRAYHDNVPEKLSESEFWSLFFKSKHFHRERNKDGHEDLFTKYEEQAQADELASGPAAKRDVAAQVDPLVNLIETTEDKESYLAEQAWRQEQGGNNNIPMDGSSRVVRKFNRHGGYVLDPSQAGKFKEDGAMNRFKPGSCAGADSLEESVRLEDLENRVEESFMPLTLANTKLYFQRSESSNALVSNSNSNSNSTASFLSAIPSLNLSHAFPSSLACLQVFNELQHLAESRSVSVGRTNSSSNTNAPRTTTSGGVMTPDSIPSDFQSLLYTYHYSVCELLRHFWGFRSSAQHSNSAEIKDKINRIVAKMEEKLNELENVRKSLPHDQKNSLAPLLKPITDQLHHTFDQADS